MPERPNLGAIILDNNGGITLQLGTFVRYYDDSNQAAEDLVNWLTTPWYRPLSLIREDVRGILPAVDDGGYRSVVLDRNIDTPDGLAVKILEAAAGCRHFEELARSLQEYGKRKQTG